MPALLPPFLPSPDILPMPEHLAQALAPAACCVYEWTDYWVKYPGATRVRVGATSVVPLDLGSGLFRVRFENQLGLAEIQPMQDKHPLQPACVVEVISRKFPTPQQHIDFYRALLDDLFARAARLPFAFGSETGRRVGETLRPPTPLFAFHYLCNNAETLMTALRVIQSSPHQQLVDFPTFVPIAQASEIEADVLLELVQGTENWQRAPLAGTAARLLGHLPTHVWQRQALESTDTRENRFVRHFVRLLVATAEALQVAAWWDGVPPERQALIKNLVCQLDAAQAVTPLAAAGEMRAFPANSHVLTSRDGYRELASLWHSFHLARKPLFGQLQEALDTRDTALLYEMWAFLALVETIARVLDQPPTVRLTVTDELGIPWGAEASFGLAGKLCYNRTFARPRSYSVPFRPDFAWITPRGLEIVLDAKFRLEHFGSDLESLESAATTAKRADLYKMHAYRDALGVRAAAVVYPGDTTVFYGAGAERHAQLDLRELLTGDLSGVGALPMSPAQANLEA